MRKAITGLAVLALSLGVIGRAAGVSDTASHDVTVTVPTIDLIAVSGTPGTLTIAEPTGLSDPGGEPMYSNEDTSCRLLWLTNGTGRKITVELDSGNLPDGLKLLATVTPTAGKGTSEGEVEVTETPKEIVTGINNKWEWNATISYKASATEEAEPTTETVTVTYTITN